MKLIDKVQALDAIKNGDFGTDITDSAARVAIILTQSWCPQWHSMKMFVSNFTGAEVYYLEYDKTDYFESFRTFKENTFRNGQIPYIRYYCDGKLAAETNAVSLEDFQRMLGL
jgi:hypothetical protein